MSMLEMNKNKERIRERQEIYKLKQIINLNSSSKKY